MNNQITRITPTVDNPDGIGFVPDSVAIGLGITKGPGGVGNSVITGPLVAFVTQDGTLPLPTAASVDGGFYYFQPMTNTEKLALPIDTPVGTRVKISDWEDAELTGPKQILAEADPSDEEHWTTL